MRPFRKLAGSVVVTAVVATPVLAVQISPFRPDRLFLRPRGNVRQRGGRRSRSRQLLAPPGSAAIASRASSGKDLQRVRCMIWAR